MALIIISALKMYNTLFHSFLGSPSCMDRNSSDLQLFRHYHGWRQSSNRREEACCSLASVLHEKLIHDHDGCHRLDNGDGPRDNTRIVTTPCGQGPRCTIILRRFLGLRDGGRGFEPNSKSMSAFSPSPIAQIRT